MTMVRVLSLLATVRTIFACDIAGTYTIMLSGAEAGAATVTEPDTLNLDLGTLGASSGTFSRNGGVTSGTGTATLSGGTGAMQAADGTHEGPFSWDASCKTLTISLTIPGISSIDLVKQASPSPPADEPCFPSSSTVTLANGTPTRMDALKEGDMVVAVTASGALTTDSVSFLSIAKPEAEATFIALTTAAGTLTLTPEHHLPVGAVCCSELKKARDVSIGELVWTRQADAIAPHAVVAAGLAIKSGLHSPVLTGGSFPVVDGVVTSFDAMEGVALAKVGLGYLTSLCQATGTCGLVRSTFMSAEPKYIAPPGDSTAARAMFSSQLAK